MLASLPMDGGTRPRSPAASSPIKYVQLSGNFPVLGVVCNRIEFDPDRANHPSSSIYRAKSLLHFGSRILVDDVFWIPTNSGLVVGWVMA